MAKTGKIFLYGTIRAWSENSAAEFTQRFTQASAGCDSLELHLHCYGGDCFEGNLIYNLIRSSKIPVDIYVDGIAASMGSIIMLAARKVFMSDNAFVMIHAPKSWVDGTADDFTKAAKLLASLEKTFVKVYQARTGKTEAEVRQWLVGDNWFSAQDAVDAKLVDGVVDAISPADVADLMLPTVATPPAEMLYSRYTGLVTETQSNHSNHSNQKQTMDKKSLIAKFSLQGVTEQSTDAEIEAAIETKISAETTARVTAETALAEGKKARIASMIATAKASGKITEANAKTFESIGETLGEQSLATALESIKPIASITTQLGIGSTGNAGTASRADWDFDRWQKEDPRGLEALPYEEMNALFVAKFKTNAPK